MSLPTFDTAAAEDPAQSPIAYLGQKQFEAHCAVCHGLDAKGEGAFSVFLTRPPPDLTLLKRGNGGFFPFERTYEAIDGRTLPAGHGTREMPIWGKYLGEVIEPGAAETSIRGRILEILIYLSTIQEP